METCVCCGKPIPEGYQYCPVCMAKSFGKLRTRPSETELLAAIRKKCLDCMCNHVKLVADCNSKDCPLHPYRCAEALRETGQEVRMDLIHDQLSMSVQWQMAVK